MVNTVTLYPDEISVLRLFSDLCSQLPDTFYIIGGWAVDIWVGHKTRPHSDFDLLYLREHRSDLINVLCAHGCTYEYEGYTAKLKFNDLEISIFPALTPIDPLPLKQYCSVEFHGMPINVLDPLALLSIKEHLHHRFGVNHYLDKDLHDIKTLRSVLTQG